MTAAPIKTWSPGETLLLGDLNNEFANIYAEINNISGANIIDGTITPAKFTDGANPEVFFGEIFNDQVVVTGFTYVSDTGLSVTLAPGTAYILKTSTSPTKLVRVVKTLSSTINLSPSLVQFVHLKSNGQFAVDTNASFIDAVTLLKVTTDGVGVTAQEDVRDTDFLEAAKIARNYSDNVEIQVSSATQVVIKSGTHFRDNTNKRSYTFDSDQTVDITASGENGLDQGSEAASKWYALVAYADVAGLTAPRGLLVEAANFPGSMILPDADAEWRRVAWVRNDGSSNFVQGRKYHGLFYYEDDQNTGSFTDTGFATKSLASQCPPTCREAFGYGRPAGGGASILSWRETGSGATGHDYGDSNGSSGGNTWFLLDATQQCDFKVSANNHVIDIAYYKDDLEEES